MSSDGSLEFDITATGASGNDVRINGFEIFQIAQAEVVPGPSAFVLGCLGLLALASFRWRKRTA